MTRRRAGERMKLISIGSAMADIALLLLVFFMATISEPPTGKKIELPVAVTRSADSDCIYLTIASGGGIYLRGKQVAAEDIPALLPGINADRNTPISILADRMIPYGRINPVLAALKKSEYYNVLFISKPRDRGAR